MARIIYNPNKRKELLRSRPMVNNREAEKISQTQYLQILFDDLGYDRLHRNDKLSEAFGRKIGFLDDLQSHEISTMINILREQKYGSTI